jgi:GGDEF domain-containing protein
MRVFDRIDPHDVERREWHLWLLVLATMSVFAVAIVLLAYPSVFLDPLLARGLEARKAFFGFCVLSVLLLAYLANRQLALARIRKGVFKAQEDRLRVQTEVAASLLGSLPDLPLFQARLRAEFQRAALGHQPFSLVLVSVKPAADSPAGDNRVIALMVGAFKRKLRRDDLIYLLAPQIFCILLPGVTCDNASRISERMIAALSDARAASGLTYETKMLNYPEQTKSLQGFEEAVRTFAGITVDAQSGRGLRHSDSPVTSRPA